MFSQDIIQYKTRGVSTQLHWWKCTTQFIHAKKSSSHENFLLSSISLLYVYITSTRQLAQGFSVGGISSKIQIKTFFFTNQFFLLFSLMNSLFFAEYKSSSMHGCARIKSHAVVKMFFIAGIGNLFFALFSLVWKINFRAFEVSYY